MCIHLYCIACGIRDARIECYINITRQRPNIPNANHLQGRVLVFFFPNTQGGMVRVLSSDVYNHDDTNLMRE